MPLFLREDQVALANHVYTAERANEAEAHAESWSEAVHIEVEERWLARWRDPEGHAAALEHMDILAGKESGEESFAVKSLSTEQHFRRHPTDRGSSADGRSKKTCSSKVQRIVVGATAAAGNRQ